MVNLLAATVAGLGVMFTLALWDRSRTVRIMAITVAVTSFSFAHRRIP